MNDAVKTMTTVTTVERSTLALTWALATFGLVFMGCAKTAETTENAASAVDSLQSAGDDAAEQVAGHVPALHQGTFVWYECVSNDVAASKAFYTELFGWTVEEMPMGEDGVYHELKNGDVGVGGVMSPPAGVEVPSHWTAYVHVEDVDASLASAVAAGGQVLVAANDVPNVGRMALVQDPQGAPINLFKFANAGMYQGFGGDHGWWWTELWSTDVSGSLTFYKNLLGYSSEVTAMANGDYHVLSTHHQPSAGVMAVPHEGVPSMWVPYLQVADCDATVAKAETLGATVMMPANDVPDVARIAILTSPTGEVFGIAKPVHMP